MRIKVIQRSASEIAGTKYSFRFELSPPDLIETEFAYPDKERYQILKNNEYGLVATQAGIGAPQPEAKVPVTGGVHGFTIVFNKKTGSFFCSSSILINDEPDRPFFYEAVSGKCQKG